MYMKGNYLEAYHFITKYAHSIKGVMAQIYNFRFTIACKAGLSKLAIQIMDEAIITKGYWYSYQYLMEDDDLEPLKKSNEFNRLVNICKAREKKAKINEKPELKVYFPGNMEKMLDYPLMMALHGDQENIKIAEDYWISSTEKKYILALPQSSQIQFSDGYEWKDMKKGLQELQIHYHKLLKNYNINRELTIITGFSAGGRLALHSILKDIIHVKGCILVAPWLPEIEDWHPLMHKLKEKNTPCYLICGDKDKDCYVGTKKFAETLKIKKIPYLLKIFKGLDHEFPEDFNVILQNALNYFSKI